MDSNKNIEWVTVRKTGDTLLVLHHETGTVGIVKGLSDNGEVNRVSPEELNRNQRLEMGRQRGRVRTLIVIIIATKIIATSKEIEYFFKWTSFVV
ncbi:hypothetical protein [Chryseobacterium sediminis]|uniref:hypothetical protein n=1 Tax=Chryseobacterium sediminis TaxID=1679494 RepID=UPI00285617EE|nr:hypothetical protein [Chryseobacterium sediminis]MDR6464584.1 hypothetical protein [Chryseobacterium sediminis]